MDSASPRKRRWKIYGKGYYRIVGLLLCWTKVNVGEILSPGGRLHFKYCPHTSIRRDNIWQTLPKTVTHELSARVSLLAQTTNCVNTGEKMPTNRNTVKTLNMHGHCILFWSGIVLLAMTLIIKTKLYGYDRNDDGIMLNKRIYWEHPKQDCNINI